ncbi:Immunogenic protein [uncultured Gammaproteobacteria bacterium]
MAMVLLCGAMLSGAWPAAATADEVRFLRIGTATTGGLYFPLGGVIANLISNPPGSRPCDRGGSCGVPGLIAVALATAGSVENIELLRNGAIEAAIVQTNVASWAFQGTALYRGKPPFQNLRAIGRLLTEAAHIVVRANSPIRTVNDLRNRIISVGEPGSGSLVHALLILGELGLTESVLQMRYSRPTQAADDLADGKIDAMFIMGAHPYPAVRDLAHRLPIRLLPIEAETGEALRRQMDFLVTTQIGDTDYPGVAATPTVGSGALLLVRDDLDETLVYGVTAALWHDSSSQAFGDEMPPGVAPSLASALNGLPVPLHPGASRYYRERQEGGDARAKRPPAAPAPSQPPALPDMLPSR